MKIKGYKWMCAFMLLMLCGCGGSATGVSNPPSIELPSSGNAAAAIGAMFSTNSETSSNSVSKVSLAVANIFIKQAIAQEGQTQCDNDPGCMCERVIDGMQSDDRPIEDSKFVVAGSYGSFNNPIEVTESDFCTMPDGTTENTGSGPDGLGRFAGFRLYGDIRTSCTDANSLPLSLSMLSGSTGIWRETDEQSDGTPAYSPQIYGSFDFSFDGAVVTYDCTIFLDEDEVILFSDCSDSRGNTVDLLSDASCRIVN